MHMELFLNFRTTAVDTSEIQDHLGMHVLPLGSHNIKKPV